MDVTVTLTMIKAAKTDFLVDVKITVIRIAKETLGIVRSASIATEIAARTTEALVEDLAMSKSDVQAKACLSYHLKVSGTSTSYD